MIRVMRRALELSHLDFTVLEGLRTLERQHQLYAQGASTTMNSRHLTGHAVDIAPIVDGAVTWHWPHYHELAAVVKQAAEECGVALEWGGDWTSFKDGPHWQLPWAGYPAESYDATRAASSSAASIDADGLQVDRDSVVEEDRDRTGLAAAGATAAGGGVAATAALDLAESEGVQDANGPAEPASAGAAEAVGDRAPDAPLDSPAGETAAAESAPSGSEGPPAVEADADQETAVPVSDSQSAEAGTGSGDEVSVPGDSQSAQSGPSDAAGEAADSAATAVVADQGEAEAMQAAGDASSWIARFIASENTLEIIALVLGGVVVILGLYLLIRRIIRWSRRRRADRRARKAQKNV